MIYVLVIAAGLWVLGREMQAPVRARWLMIAILYVAVLVLLILLPDGHPMQQALGGSFGEWLLLGGLAAAIFGYRNVLTRLRKFARTSTAETIPDTPKGAFQGAEIERYARHIMLREIGGPGQKKLKQSKVLVVGAGGLGSPACMYLAAAGVGTIGIIDDDVVENTNLQRQIAHTDDRIGMPKVFSAQASMKTLNPYVDVRPFHRKLTQDIAAELIADFDLVLDGTDNFETRYLVNEACVQAGKPLISGALTQWEGQVSLFDPAKDAPCYRCVFPEAPAAGLAPSCAEAGVVGPITGVIGSMMAVEAIKTIAGAGDGLAGRMLIYDALYSEVRVIGLNRREDCETCGAGHPSAES